MTEPDPYLEIARRFFNEFLELKLSVERGRMMSSEKYEKEVRKWKTANEALKESCQRLAKENERLEGELQTILSERDNARRELNEMLLRHGRLEESVERMSNMYPLDQHMSDKAYKEWVKIMQEIPTRRG